MAPQVVAAGSMSASSSTGTSITKIIVITGVSVLAFSAGYYIYSRYCKASRRRSFRKAINEINNFPGNPPEFPASFSLDTIDNNTSGTPTPTSSGFVSPTNDIRQAERLKSEGNRKFGEGKFQEAVDVYSQAIQTYPEGHPDRALAFSNRAASYINLRLYDQVIKDCNEALKIKPLFSKALDRRAKAYEASGNLFEALHDYTLLSMVEKFSNESTMKKTEQILKSLSEKQAMEELSKREKKLTSPFACKEFFSTFTPIELPAKDMTMDILNERIASGKGTLTDYYQRALFSFQCNRYDQAVGDLKMASEFENVPQEVHFNLHHYYGSLLFLSGDFADAIKHFEIAIKAIPTGSENSVLSEVFIKLAFLLFESGKMEEAVQKLAQASELGAENPYVAYHRAEIFTLLGELNAALESYDLSIKLKPDFSAAYIHKTKVLISQEQVQAAHDLMQQAALKFPKRSEIVNAYGETFVFFQKFDEAKSHFIRAVELDPNNTNALLNQAVLLMTLETHQRFAEPGTPLSQGLLFAKSLLEKALSIDPSFESAHMQLANLFLMIGEDSQALKHFDQAIASCKSYQELVNVIATKESSLVQTRIFSAQPHLAVEFSQLVQQISASGMMQ